MLHSPLFEEIRNYLKTADPEKQIFLYVPYIKTKTLSKLVDGIKNITIITTWHMRDLVFGSSEVELYQFCKDHNYTLYVNNKIHLKVYSIALDSAIVATGNISVGGLEGGNEECGILVKELSVSDRTFFEEIKNNATLIDEDQYERHLERSEEILKENDTVDYDDLITDTKKEYFLRSELPMTRFVNDLLQGYGDIQEGRVAQGNEESDACIKHDLKTYQIESNLSQYELRKKLKLRFFAHPFTKKIDELIEEGAYWGAVRRWVRDHCKDVPLPRLWDLTENTQILYRWFVELGDGEYEVDVPGARSERISKKTSTTLSQHNPITQFKIGQFYHHDEIWKPLGIGFSGGIRSSIKNKLVILFWNALSVDPRKEKHSDYRANIYEDYFDEKTGLYHYIGEGQVSDQTLDSGSGGNKRIVKAKEMGRTIHLFHQHEYAGKHEYLGEVELVGQETEIQPDIDRKERKVLVFLLRPVG